MISPERPSVALQCVTYRELSRHSSYNDAWLSINGVVYNVTRLMRHHPFGDTFRANLGTECAGILSSSHVLTRIDRLLYDPAFLRRHDVTIVGRLDVSADCMDRSDADALLKRIVYKDTASDALWLELKEEVVRALKADGELTYFTELEGAAYLLYYLSAYCVLSWLAWTIGSPLAAALLAFHMICAMANVAHMATHHGFTRSSVLNIIAMHLFDLSGGSGLEWQIAHQTHHNQPHSSLDNQTNGFDYLGLRIHRNMPRMPWHKHQWFYYWLLIATYLPYKLFETSLWFIVNRRFVARKRDVVAHFVAKGLLLIQVDLCAAIHGIGYALLLLAIYCMAFSYTAFFLLFNNHEETHELLGSISDLRSVHGSQSWVDVQIRTSGNWYPTNWLLAFVEFHYGYFNYHIEHHLFPTLKPRLLKKISPIVRAFCARHGIPYLMTTYWEVQRSMQRHLRKMGLPESDSVTH